MPVQKVEQNKSCLGNGIKSAAIGGAIGLAAQYALPLTTQEMDSEYRAVVKNIKENAAKTRRETVKALRNTSLKQPALDAYVKSAPKMAKASIRSYNRQLKAARGAVPFVAAGAIIGLVTSFVRNVFRTDAA